MFARGRPAVCLVVSGPGLIHALAGMANANENCWPLVVVGGSCETPHEGMGGFQEFPQVECARPFSKYSARPSSIERIPFCVEKAIRLSVCGRPGACYIDLPGDMIRGAAPTENIVEIPYYPCPPKTFADPGQVSRSVDILRTAKRPLVIIGKGAAYGQGECQIRDLLDLCQFPFLPTPMAKGVVPDDDNLCVAPARSRALLQADVILLLGGRLNWILHLGLPPRFSKDVKIIQVDIHPEAFSSNVPLAATLQGNIDSVVQQIINEVRRRPFVFSPLSDWWTMLRQKMAENTEKTRQLVADKSLPMNYYVAFEEIRNCLPKNTIIVSEGANTMDIGRTMIPNYFPRHRLDAGTFGTMGVGPGFAIAAALWCRDEHPNKRVVCIEGDSAFGFSGMELETVCRYNLPIIFIVINNNGIVQGMDADTWSSNTEEGTDQTLSNLPTWLKPESRYERIMMAFGGDGYFVRTPEELKRDLGKCLNERLRPSLINVMIDPSSQRKAQDFQWLTSSADVSQTSKL